MKKKTFAILGSTGSIGKSSLNVINKLTNTKVKLIFADKNFKEILNQIKIYRPRIVVVNSFETFKRLKKKFFKDRKIIILKDYKESKKYLKKIDVTISAIPGISGLEPTIFFTEISKKVLIANKESVICGWSLIISKAKKFKTKLIPIDSEHFSINFLLKNYSLDQINKIYITASGGPFLNLNKSSLKKIKPNQAIKHPKWKMGKKISVDSSTLMNKVLEIIEAVKLFSIDLDKLEVIVHPQSLVHSIIELKNGLRIFVYHEPDMRIPIANAIEESNSHPKIFDFNYEKLSNTLTFFPVDKKKFPIVEVINKININNSSPILLNAANEIFVDQFLKKRIKFLDIYKLLNRFLNSLIYIKTSKIKANSIHTIKKIDQIARNAALKIVYNYA
jgi:1-deoxy-D-xylulose-5-phosphate reductoisomerase